MHPAYEPKMTFEMTYLRIPGIFIDGPQEQFLAYAREEVDMGRRSMHFIGGGGLSINGKQDWTGTRRYEWVPGEPAREWKGRPLMLELPKQLLEMLDAKR
jgi:hypothetical protein